MQPYNPASNKDTLELRWWLLGFGDMVEVLGPKTLRKEFAATAKRLS
ncbi:MAG: WYL domain-containing protein [Nitrospira sp.]|nr:WYL domain-containing protein [Nitrospira sp.]